MINIDVLVTSTLKQVGTPFSQLIWNDELNIPNQYITWVEIARVPQLSADDKELIQCYYISVQVFSKYGQSYTSIIEKIEECMLNNNFLKSSYSTAKYDKDSGYICKPLSFKYYETKQQ